MSRGGRPDAATVVTALTPHLADGDLSCILCDHGAARPLAVDLRVRYGATAFAGPVWGGRLSARAIAREAAGVIVLGRVRNVGTLARGALGAAALGVAPHRSGADDAGATDVPLAVGPWVLHPGDVIVADDNGVVAVPAGSFGEVADHINAWVAHERAADQEACS